MRASSSIASSMYVEACHPAVAGQGDHDATDLLGRLGDRVSEHVFDPGGRARAVVAVGLLQLQHLFQQAVATLGHVAVERRQKALAHPFRHTGLEGPPPVGERPGRCQRIPSSARRCTSARFHRCRCCSPCGASAEAQLRPESAQRRREQLRQAVVSLVAPEFTRQMHALADARTDYGIAKASMGWCGGTVTEAQRRELRRTEKALEDARATAWPNKTMEQLGVLAGAVIDEMVSSRECFHCGGKKILLDPRVAGVVTCAECGGSGHEPLSGRKHAAAIGADWSAYSRFWRPVYKWMLCGFRAAESRAARRFNRALPKAA